ncbi:MAG: DUF2231 domain-containing protein [Thermodesulfobacteriota bacterium]
MRKFELCIRGQNFLIKRDGKVNKTGFYAARCVEAQDMSGATDIAMKSFRADLKDMVVNSEDDPPVLNVEEICEVYYFQDEMALEERTVPTKGYLWDDEKKEVESGIIEDPWHGDWHTLWESIKEKDTHIHTILIHFTNALYPVAALFIFLFLIFGSSSLNETYLYIMLLATISTPISYVAGIYEWKRRYQGAMKPIFVSKIRYGPVIFIIGGLCTLWRYLSPSILENFGITSVLFILLNLSILPVLVYLGHLGGVILHEGVE